MTRKIFGARLTPERRQLLVMAYKGIAPPQAAPPQAAPAAGPQAKPPEPTILDAASHHTAPAEPISARPKPPALDRPLEDNSWLPDYFK